MFWNFIYVVFVIVCIFLIVTVLLQPGKAGGLGAAFGGGGNTVFGASGGTPVFRRMTTVAAVCFMLLSLLLAWKAVDKSVDTTAEAPKKHGLDFGKKEAAKTATVPEAAGLVAAPDAAAPTEATPDAAAPTEAAPETVTIPESAPVQIPAIGNPMPKIDTTAPFGMPADSPFKLDTPNFDLQVPSLDNTLNLQMPAAPEAAAPAADNAPAAEVAPAADNAPAAEVAPAADNAPAAEVAPAADNAPAAEVAPANDNAPAAEAAPANDNAPAAEAAPAAEPVPAPAA